MKINLSELIPKAMLANNEFYRMDIIIRYIAFEKFDKTGELDWLYWKMQYGKLELLRNRNDSDIIKPEDLLHQFNRLPFLYKAIKERTPLCPLVVNKSYRLIDGAHRLAGYMYFNVSPVETEIKDKPSYFSSWDKGNWLNKLYNQKERDYLENRRKRITSDINGDRWL